MSHPDDLGDPMDAGHGLRSVSLEVLDAVADRLTRVDRKYVVDRELVGPMLADHRDRLSMLEIDGARTFAYTSLYFDTPDLALHRAAATGRRHRVKVRTRVYDDSGTAMLEVKAKDGRGQTVKHRMSHEREHAAELGAAGRAFVDDIAAAPGLAESLVPTLTTRYRRSTLVDLAAGHRATIDERLVCEHVDGRCVRFDKVIVETKSDLGPSELDRWLWHHGLRPERISKYCTTMALLEPDLPGNNRWHRTIVRHFAA